MSTNSPDKFTRKASRLFVGKKVFTCDTTFPREISWWEQSFLKRCRYNVLETSRDIRWMNENPGHPMTSLREHMIMEHWISASLYWHFIIGIFKAHQAYQLHLMIKEDAFSVVDEMVYPIIKHRFNRYKSVTQIRVVVPGIGTIKFLEGRWILDANISINMDLDFQDLTVFSTLLSEARIALMRLQSLADSYNES